MLPGLPPTQQQLWNVLRSHRGSPGGCFSTKQEVHTFPIFLLLRSPGFGLSESLPLGYGAARWRKHFYTNPSPSPSLHTPQAACATRFGYSRGGFCPLVLEWRWGSFLLCHLAGALTFPDRQLPSAVCAWFSSLPNATFDASSL